MSTEQNEIDAMLFALTLECARPSWRFRLLFNARERQMLGFAINTFMGQRHRNLLIAELDRRYFPNIGNAGAGAAQQRGAQSAVWHERAEGGGECSGGE